MSIVSVLTREIERLKKRCEAKQRRIRELERQRNMWKARAQTWNPNAAACKRYRARA